MTFTPVERRMADEYEQTPYLDDSPLWWNALLLPLVVMLLVFGLLGLLVWDGLRKLGRRAYRAALWAAVRLR